MEIDPKTVVIISWTTICKTEKEVDDLVVNVSPNYKYIYFDYKTFYSIQDVLKVKKKSIKYWNVFLRNLYQEYDDIKL